MSEESIDGFVEYDAERDGYVLHPDPTMPGGETAQDEFTPASELGLWDERVPAGDVIPDDLIPDDLIPDDLFSPRPADPDPSVWDVLENLLPEGEATPGLGLQDDPNYAPNWEPINELPEEGLA